MYGTARADVIRAPGASIVTNVPVTSWATPLVPVHTKSAHRNAPNRKAHVSFIQRLFIHLLLQLGTRKREGKTVTLPCELDDYAYPSVAVALLYWDVHCQP